MSSPEAKYISLVDQLIERTGHGILPWRASDRSDTFVAVLHRGMIEIRRNEELDEDGHPVEWFELFVLDDRGRVADRLSSNPQLSGLDSTRFDALRLAKLLKLARERAIGTTDIVDGILEELSVDQVLDGVN